MRQQNRGSSQNWRIIALFLGFRVMPSYAGCPIIFVFYTYMFWNQKARYKQLLIQRPGASSISDVFRRRTKWQMAVQNKIQTGFQEGESNIKSFRLETCPRSFHTFQLLYRIPKLLLFRCSTKFWRIFGNKSWTFCFSLSEQSNLRIKRVSASCRQKHPSRLSTLEKTNLKQCFTFVFIVVWRSSVKKITMISCEKSVDVVLVNLRWW